MESSPGKKKKLTFRRILVGFCIVLLLAVSITGYFLKRGISAKSLTLGSIIAYDCKLIWNNKLELQVGEILMSETGRKLTSSTAASSANIIRKSIDVGYYMARVFSKFSIKRFHAGGNSFTLDVNEEGPGSHTLVLQSENMVLRSLLTFDRNTLRATILESVNSRFNTELKGELQLHGKDSTLTGSVSALVNGSFPVSVDIAADSKQVAFEGRENGTITEIRPLVELFGLSQNIQRWITDYLSGSRYHLKSFKGIVPWADPKSILDSLEAVVGVDDTEYTFAQGLEPIKSTYTEVVFRKGVLKITPFEATFYGQSGGESWLDINFNDPRNILLSAYIKTRAAANDDILTLLKYYKIDLPFKQVEGLTETDLTLLITLNKLKIEATGVFEIDDGLIAWGGKRYRARDARIALNNSDVSIDHLEIGYDEMLTARISGLIQAKKKTGDLDIELDRLDLKLGNSQLKLDPSSSAHMEYHFEPDGHVLTAHPTSWLLDNWKMNLGSFRAPVSVDDLAIELPPVRLLSPSLITSEISGYYSARNHQARLICDLLEYNVKGLELKSPRLSVSIEYDQGFSIATEDTTQWELSRMPVTLYPSQLNYRDEIFSIANSRIRYGTFFDSRLSGHYNWQNKQGAFSLEEIDITDQNLKNELDVGKRAEAEIDGSGGTFIINLPAFDLKISTDQKKNWSAVLGDLSKTYNYSEIQQKYKIKEGSFVISSANGKRPYEFSADLTAPYPLIVVDGEPTDTLQVSGRLTENGVFAKINNDIEFRYFDKDLSINSSRHGYNIGAIKQFVRDLSQSNRQADPTEDKASSFMLKLKAMNSQVYLSPASRVLADAINLELYDGKLMAKLVHGPGTISLQLEDGAFVVDGNELNDEFMGALVKNSNFKGGRMSLASAGSIENFSAIFTVTDTTLANLAAVNNVMAFLNTVPALVTFSMPEYNQSGLPIESAVGGLTFKNNVATFESLEIISPELQGRGKGTINFNDRDIDMDIHLKTQAGINVGKIPLLGYVMAGDENRASLNLEITGGFDDPEVRDSLIKDFTVYPSEVLLRTLKLPFHISKKIGEIIDNKKTTSRNNSDGSLSKEDNNLN